FIVQERVRLTEQPRTPSEHLLALSQRPFERAAPDEQCLTSPPCRCGPRLGIDRVHVAASIDEAPFFAVGTRSPLCTREAERGTQPVSRQRHPRRASLVLPNQAGDRRLYVNPCMLARLELLGRSETGHPGRPGGVERIRINM